MAEKTTYKVQKRRKRVGKTNYKKRLKLLLSHKPRLVVRKSHNRITFQIIKYDQSGDQTLVSASSKELSELGYKGHSGNTRAGYLLGYLGGKRALKNKIKSAVLDIGMVSPVKGSAVFGVLLGALEAGLDVPHSKEILPPAEHFSDLSGVLEKITGE
jgi:large subunit ribosomal protein L18